jgi:hypothetical protein
VRRAAFVGCGLRQFILRKYSLSDQKSVVVATLHCCAPNEVSKMELYFVISRSPSCPTYSFLLGQKKDNNNNVLRLSVLLVLLVRLIVYGCVTLPLDRLWTASRTMKNGRIIERLQRVMSSVPITLV